MLTFQCAVVIALYSEVNTNYLSIVTMITKCFLPHFFELGVRSLTSTYTSMSSTKIAVNRCMMMLY